ncbi:MAG: GntR family transcriptional regulator [Victivallales bacterium]|nr:GntR family transcriptional regulator [Victivallales bacterium]
MSERILSEINSGSLQAGDVLPSRQQYMRRYKYSRGTVDAAIGMLKRDGHVYSRRGGGTYVSGRSAGVRIERVVVVDGGISGHVAFRRLESGSLAGGLGTKIESAVCPADDVYANLDELCRPGNAVVWMRPSFKLYLAMTHLASASVPQLLIGRDYGGYDHVTTDACEGILCGLRVLAERSREFALISDRSDPDRPYISERQIAFYRGCVELGLILRPEWIFDFDPAQFSQELSRIGRTFFMREDRPRNIFIENVRAAPPLIAFAEAQGKSCGKDFMLLVFDFDPDLLGCEGVLMLSQDWEAMRAMVWDWIKSKNEDAGRSFKRRVVPELVFGKGN